MKLESSPRESEVYIVENLTLWIWFRTIFPKLISHKFAHKRSVSRCYAIDAHSISLNLARTTCAVLGIKLEKLDFTVEEVRDTQGLQTRYKVLFQDLADIEKIALSEPLFQGPIHNQSIGNRLSRYLAKTLTLPWNNRISVWQPMLLIQVSSWVMRQSGSNYSRSTLFLERRPWMKTIEAYADRFNIQLIPVRPSLRLKTSITNKLPRTAKNLALYLKYGRGLKKISNSHDLEVESETLGSTIEINSSSVNHKVLTATNSPKLAVNNYTGQLNLASPERHSELHFWQSSKLQGSDLVVCSAQSASAFDSEMYTEIQNHEMSAVALHPGATKLKGIPVISSRPKFQITKDGMGLGNLDNSIESQWVRNWTASYWDTRSHWADFFEYCNAKIYVTWFKFDASLCPIADAMESIGGITAIHQRAYESDPSPVTSTSVDLAFGYSHFAAEIERKAKSEIPYYVITGYLGDHRFNYWKEHAKAMRHQLTKHGAKRIICYLDENTADDARWSTGHHISQTDYAFLLEKVLEHPWMGLLLKPKVPRTLRQRLGPVAELLKAAEETGRCFVYEEGTIQTSHPPVAAAFASDIAIHGHMVGATAGIEMGISGVPTLYLDREGWGISPLYRLGLGKVVFNDWISLWNNCQEHWASKSGIKGFGDWTNMLYELDPFRDGRATERMGNYLNWILDGFKAGRTKSAILADAANRYREAWGHDKVISINPEPTVENAKLP